MKSAGLAFFTDIHWTLIGLIIFFLSFLLLISLHFYNLRGGAENRLAQMPFEGDDHGT